MLSMLVLMVVVTLSLPLSVWLGFGMELEKDPHQFIGRDRLCRFIGASPTRFAPRPGMQAADDGIQCDVGILIASRVCGVDDGA